MSVHRQLYPFCDRPPIIELYSSRAPCNTICPTPRPALRLRPQKMSLRSPHPSAASRSRRASSTRPTPSPPISTTCRSSRPPRPAQSRRARACPGFVHDDATMKWATPDKANTINCLGYSPNTFEYYCENVQKLTDRKPMDVHLGLRGAGRGHDRDRRRAREQAARRHRPRDQPLVPQHPRQAADCVRFRGHDRVPRDRLRQAAAAGRRRRRQDDALLLRAAV